MNYRYVMSAFAISGSLLAVPIAAHAAVHPSDIVVDVGATGDPTRFPSSSKSDWSMPETKSAGHAGSFASGITTCYPATTNHYDTRLMRDRTLAPDQVVSQFENVGFCHVGRVQHSDLHWDGGNFHFDANAYPYNKNQGRGWDPVQWQ